MPEIIFNPARITAIVPATTKILAAAVRHQVAIRHGCAACQCGTCAVAVEAAASQDLNPPGPEEKKLLAKMGLPTSGHIRLACQARILSGTVAVDLNYQLSYSPDQNGG